MEDMMIKTHEFMTMAANANAQRLAMHKDSKKICKPRQKIRIIHIFAPEIIKTDVANFRALVQRLTGKPRNEKICRSKMPILMSTPTGSGRDLQQEPISTQVSLSNNKTNLISRKLELRNEHRGFEPIARPDRMKVEEDRIWDVESSGGYLGGFAHLEGFLSDMNGTEFPLFT